jgi:outer membrane receptor protein involved in Fe transport
MNFTKSTLSLAVSSALISSLNATANEEPTTKAPIEVITVSSDFRQQNLLKTPASLSVLTDIEIKQRNAQHLEELIAVSPNVNYASGSQRARYYQIRGIGERAQFKEPINPSVGMIIDEVDFTGIGSIANLFDTSQVEIFRGPQGTRFGANALAGMINITTSEPTDEFEGAIKLDVGNYDSYDLGLALSGPVTDDVNYRFAINKHTSDGYMENVYLNTDDTNNRNELNIRGKLSIAATKDLTIDLTGFYFDFNNGYDAFSLDKTRTTYSDEPGFDDQETKALAVKFTYEGFDGFTLVSILSTADSDLAYGYDEDWAYEGISYPENIENQDFAYWEYTSKDHYFREKSVQTIEFRALSKVSNKLFNDTTSWVTGVHFKQDDEDLLRQYTYLDSDFNSSFNTQSIAVYGQLDSQFNKQWSLTTGLRVEHRSADYINSDNFNDSLNDTMVGGKLVLSYQQSDDSFWYASINRGFKAGGANTDGSLPDELRTFDPEYLTNYELGYKVSLLDNNAYIRTALFYMDRTDMQVKSSNTISRSDGSTQFISYLGNAASGENYGLEVETSWQVTDSINLYASLGLLDTEFNDFITADGLSLSGEEQAHAPNYQFNIGVNYQPTDAWLFNISLDSKDEFYFSDTRYYDYDGNDSVEIDEAIPEQDLQSKASVLLNASISYLADNWQVKLWGRNLGDKNYANRGFYFPNDPRDGYAPKQYTLLSEPLVFGVSLDYQF